MANLCLQLALGQTSSIRKLANGGFVVMCVYLLAVCREEREGERGERE